MISFYCDGCGNPIYIYEFYYHFDYGDYCEDCMNEHRKIAVHTQYELEADYEI